MHRRVVSSSRILVPVVLALAAAQAWGQGVREGATEVTGYTGVYHQTSATKAIIGGAVGYNVARAVQVFGDIGYIPVGYGANQVNLSGGIHINLGRKSSRVVPYIPLVVGMQHYWAGGYTFNAASFGSGFGTRCFVGRKWGIRPEFRFERFQKAEGGFNSARVTAGLFYQFGGE